MTVKSRRLVIYNRTFSHSRIDYAESSDGSNLWPDRLRLVAEVAKTLVSTPAMHPICGQIGYHPVAEVAKTLESTPAMHPICGQIGYHPAQPNTFLQCPPNTAHRCRAKLAAY